VPNPASRTYSLKIDLAGLLGRATRPFRSRLPRDVEGLLAAYARAEHEAEQVEIATALAATRCDDPRVRAVLRGLLGGRSPGTAARLLVEHGDRAALPELVRALDGVLSQPVADCATCHVEDVHTLARAIEAFGGRLTPGQRAGIAEATVRAAATWEPWKPPAGPPPPAVLRLLRVGRNEPCPCGSGRKYKRCCVGATPA